MVLNAVEILSKYFLAHAAYLYYRKSALKAKTRLSNNENPQFNLNWSLIILRPDMVISETEVSIHYQNNANKLLQEDNNPCLSNLLYEGYLMGSF